MKSLVIVEAPKIMMIFVATRRMRIFEYLLLLVLEEHNVGDDVLLILVMSTTVEVVVSRKFMVDSLLVPH